MREAGTRLDDELLVAAKRASLRRPRHRHADRPDRGAGPGAPRRDRPASGLRDGRHLRRRVRRRDAVLLLDLRRGRLTARGTAGRRARHRWSSAPDRCASARASSSTTAPSRRPRRCAGWAGSRSWSTRTRRRSRPTSMPRRASTSSRSTPRAWPRSCAPRPSTATLPDAFIQFGGQTPLGLAAAVAAEGAPLRGLDLDAIDHDRGADALRRAGRPAGHPAAGGRHGLVRRRGVRRRRAGRLSGDRPAVVRDRRPRRRLRLRPRGSGADHRPRRGRGRRAAGADRRLPGGPGARRRRHQRRRRTCSSPGCMEHVERAGVHSGDSIGVYPPQRISARPTSGSIVDAITRVALAIGVRGLINGQFIVRDDGVYLLEVNPRAHGPCRSSPRSPACPMVELATRVALGETLADWAGPAGCSTPRSLVAVKAPVFSTHKLRGVDPTLGPGDAVDRRGHRHPRGPASGDGQGARRGLAAAAACRGRWPGAGCAAVPGRTRQATAAGARGAPGAAGYRFCATGGTATALRVHGHDVEEVARVGEATGPTRTVVEAIGSGDITLVVNTPSPESRPVRDAGAIRLAATAEGILCLTSIDTALAAADALDLSLAEEIGRVRPLDAWLAGTAARA